LKPRAVEEDVSCYTDERDPAATLHFVALSNKCCRRMRFTTEITVVVLVFEQAVVAGE
jgi:DNA-directed RNA polymerase subunit N (RpoN/RPB10)